MDMLLMLLMCRAAQAFRRRLLSCAAVLLFVAIPAWATTVESANLRSATLVREEFEGSVLIGEPIFSLSPHDAQYLREEEADEIRRNIAAYPDVVVFPIQIAETLVAAATRKNIANKVAQAAQLGSIAVLYPDIGEPYRSVFAQIIGGIEGKAKVRVANFAVGQNVDIAELKNSLRLQDAKVVIALGRQGMKAAASLDDIDVVAGGVLTASDSESRNMQVNSLSPAPELLFSRLKGMMPKVRRVFAVYDPQQNTWMIELAKSAARTQGLELVSYEASDLRSAMHAYQEILATADSNQDALWLLQDSTTVEDGSVLPLVLQESWTHNLAVFSSNFGHVRRGVLFSLYPNNTELGRHLAGTALNIMASGEGAHGILPLREVLMAINLRTAKHLGIDAKRQQGFDMAFPSQ